VIMSQLPLPAPRTAEPRPAPKPERRAAEHEPPSFAAHLAAAQQTQPTPRDGGPDRAPADEPAGTAERPGSATERNDAEDTRGAVGDAEPSIRRRVAKPAHGVHGSAGIDPRRVERDIELVHPELRVRVERVIDRMREEHGHRVDVVETLRHQARQNFLFEQGRSRPGPVVTWTRNSNHSDGRAVDVIIDGSYDNPAAYARLGRIAAQEGLRTLGARDPGHLELPREPGELPGMADRRGVVAARSAPVVGAAGASGTEPTAAVAEVARVATPVAAVAAAVAPAPAAVAAVAQVAVAGGGRPARERPGAAPADATPQDPAHRHAHAMPSMFAERGNAGPSGALGNGGIGATAAARIAQMLDAQSAAPLRPLQHVVLRLEGMEGVDRIRIGLRGDTLAGSIALNDAALTERMDARLGELHRTLGERGLDAAAVRVQGAGAERAELARVAAALGIDAETARLIARSGAESSGSRERSDPESRHQPRDGQDDPRNRSRREPNRERHS
jgi:hypothetical protein